MTFSAITNIIGNTRSALVSWSRELTLEISNRPAIEYEVLIEQQAMTCEKRIKTLDQILKRMNTKLAMHTFLFAID